MVSYDVKIIHDHAERLYRQARTTIATYAAAGAIIGFILGMVLVVAMVGDATGGIIAAITSAVIVGAIGYSWGREKAFRLKLEAQLALCQTKIEENTQAR